mgnify:CR=1 FL=1
MQSFVLQTTNGKVYVVLSESKIAAMETLCLSDTSIQINDIIKLHTLEDYLDHSTYPVLCCN